VHRRVRHRHVGRIAVGIAEHRHRRIAHTARRADDSARNLAAVGNQEFAKAHATAHRGWRF